MKQLITAVCILLPTVALAQAGAGSEFDRAELFGGYSFLSVDGNGASRQNFNGWEASGLLNLNKWLGAEADLSGYYKSNIAGTNVDAHNYLFTGGPRINPRPLFFHALFGADHATASTSVAGVTASASDTAFATLLGGGVEWKIARQWAIRPSLDYVLTRHAATSQNDIRLGVGIAYAFGR
jgi:opacity protein-like surface antigen